MSGGLNELGHGIDWHIVFTFIAVGTGGSFAGNYLGSKINQRRLRQVFGVFLILMGVYILVRESAEQSPAASRPVMETPVGTDHEPPRP